MLEDQYRDIKSKLSKSEFVNASLNLQKVKKAEDERGNNFDVFTFQSKTIIKSIVDDIVEVNYKPNENCIENYKDYNSVI